MFIINNESFSSSTSSTISNDRQRLTERILQATIGATHQQGGTSGVHNQLGTQCAHRDAHAHFTRRHTWTKP